MSVIIEKSFHPPLLITDTSEQGIRETVWNFKGCTRTKTLPQGTHDVTDHRWTRPSHHWIVQVLADKTAEIRILPKEKTGGIVEAYSGFDSTTIRHHLNTTQRSAFLGGVSIFSLGRYGFGRGPVLFKEIAYNPAPTS